MCKCTPEIRTPFCGRAGCVYPEQKPMSNQWKINTSSVMQERLNTLGISPTDQVAIISLSDKLVEKARMEERERAARIAEEYREKLGDDYPIWNDFVRGESEAAEKIAKAIREKDE